MICIARACARKAKVVVLDEATSNIDVVTEQAILKLMKTEFADSTMITIAHRLNTIIASDKVAVLEAGKLIEYDSPKALASRPESYFAKLLNDLKQSEAEEEEEKKKEQKKEVKAE